MSFIITPHINNLHGGILTPIIYQHIITGIIAPHGITDLSHSIQENKVKELLSIYSITNIGSFCISQFNDNIKLLLDISFLSLSIIHFRHDMPVINNTPKYLWSCLLLYISIIYNYDIFMLYMCLSHVPKHYLTNWKYIKKNKWFNIILITTTTILCYLLGNNYLDLIINNIFYLNIVKSIVISHIIYQELYILN